MKIKKIRNFKSLKKKKILPPIQKPSLKIEAVDFPLEKKLMPDYVVTKYAQCRLEKFIFNPFKEKDQLQCWFKLMATPFTVEQ